MSVVLHQKFSSEFLKSYILQAFNHHKNNVANSADEFKNILPRGMKLPKIDAIRDTLKVVDISKLRDILKYGVRKARENKVFDNGTIDGYVVAAIDGTQTFNSDKKECENCLSAFKKGKQEKRNFHSSVVLSTIGEGTKLVIDFEQYKPGEDSATKDEGELTVAKRLIKRVSENHKNLLDVVVYDAIACNSEWINTCILAGIETVVRVKSNNIESIKEAKKKVNKMDEVAIWADVNGYESVKICPMTNRHYNSCFYNSGVISGAKSLDNDFLASEGVKTPTEAKNSVYEDTFNMKNVDKPLRFIKFLIKKPDGKRLQIMIVTTWMKMGLRTLYKIIRARQDIENSIFHNLKTECGLEHCFVHGGNAIEAVLCLMFIASNFVQLFYHKRIKKSVKTQVELIRLLIKGLYILKRKPELIFDFRLT